MFLIACRATTFAKVDYSDNQSFGGGFSQPPTLRLVPLRESLREQSMCGAIHKVK